MSRRLQRLVALASLPYRGDASALTDLLRGQVHVLFASVPGSIEYIRASKLRALAVTTTTRSQVLPDIPSLSDFLSDYDASFWAGIGAPKNSPHR
jgi:tripartite-type tricarboxylate transporter receptor subunit TctC